MPECAELADLAIYEGKSRIGECLWGAYPAPLRISPNPAGCPRRRGAGVANAYLSRAHARTRAVVGPEGIPPHREVTMGPGRRACHPGSGTVA